MKTIQNHNELRAHLRQTDWIERTPSQFDYSVSHNRYSLGIYLNTVNGHSFTIYLNRNRKQQTFSHSYTDEKTDLKEKIKKCVSFVTRKVRALEAVEREQNNAIASYYNIIFQNKLAYDDEKGCYVDMLPNGMTLYFFSLPFQHGARLVTALNREGTDVVENEFAFSKKDMQKLIDKVDHYKEMIPFLNTWVTPVKEDSLQYEESVLSFKKNQGDYAELATCYYELVKKHFPHKWVSHLFIPYYSPRLDETVMEMVFMKRNAYQQIIEPVTAVLEELTETYEFFAQKIKLPYYDVYLIQLKEGNEEAFHQLLQQWKERIEPILAPLAMNKNTDPTA